MTFSGLSASIDDTVDSVPYDPESQEFDSGDEPFPYLSDGEIFDSDESGNLDNNLDSSEVEDLNGDSGSSTSIFVTPKKPEIDAARNADSEADEFEDLATLELRKAALASIASKFESVSNTDGVSPSDGFKNSHHTPKISSSQHSDAHKSSPCRSALSASRRAASKMLHNTNAVDKYRIFLDLLTTPSASGKIGWDEAVRKLQTGERKESKGVCSNQKLRNRRMSSAASCELEKAVEQWIVIDQADSSDASATDDCAEVGLTLGNEMNNHQEVFLHQKPRALLSNDTDADGKIVSESSLDSEDLLDSHIGQDEIEDVDALRKELLISVAKKRLPSSVALSNVNIGGDYVSDDNKQEKLTNSLSLETLPISTEKQFIIAKTYFRHSF